MPDDGCPRFAIPPCDPAQVARLRRELGASEILGQVLVRRGLHEPQLAAAFLQAHDEHPPSAFAGIGRAVSLVLESIDAGRRITVHGDYDVDGICSTAVLLRALRALGASADFYLPDRAGDGYGLSLATVRRLHARGTQLLVTVDCAITAVEEVAAAQACGMQVLVTDHHAPRADGALPGAPIVHPAVCGYPSAELCATAVAYKLAQALWQARGRDPAGLEEDLDLVALATVADVVELRGESRTLVRRGLRALARTRKPGLRALMAVAGVNPSRVDERALGFGLAPRLNAAGRLARADAALELVLAEEPARARAVAEELDRVNRERRQVELRIRHAAESQIAQLGQRDAYVLAGEDWHAGVIGIVASRLSERHRRPVVLIALDAHTGRGSGRSIEGFDLLAGLSACGEHLLRFGGHRAAAGLEIERAEVHGFAAALSAHAATVLGESDLMPVERVDAVADGEQLGMALAEELRSLAPHGRGNPRVSLLLSEASFRDPRPMGEGKHVRFTVESRGARARAVAFGAGAKLPVPEGTPAQATFTLEVNEWQGVSEPRLVLRHARAAPGMLAEPDSAPVVSRGLARTAGRPRRPAAPARPRPEPEGEPLVLFALP